MGHEKAARYFSYRVIQTVLVVHIWMLSAPSASRAEELQPPREILKYSDPAVSSEQLEKPPAVFMREDIPYQLASWEIVEQELSGRMQYGESAVVYEKTGMDAEIPKTAEISIEGEEGLFSVPMVRRDYMNERWEDDFAFALTFHSYQADSYQLGEIEISAKPDSPKPELQGYEDELLRLLGLSEEYYRITGYEWGGEPYRDEAGVLCRNAEARGERLVRDCQAVYGGEVVLPPKKVYQTKAVYCLKQKREEKIKASKVKQKSGEDAPAESQEQVWIEGARHVIKRLTAVTIRLGLFLFLFMLLRILVRAGRTVWKKWGSRKQ